MSHAATSTGLAIPGIRRLALSAAVILMLAATACGEYAGSSPAAEDAKATVAAAAPASSSDKLSANHASADELRAAFEAAGLRNAEQWAHEVEEYRPYPVDDSDFTDLRRELAKYNPSPGVVDTIIALLELP